MQSFDAIVVGGGLAGKACAAALAQQGLQVLVCGCKPAPLAPAHGYAQRVYAFNAASRRLLQQLQAWPLERVEPVARMRIAADGAALQFDAWSESVEALAWIAESDAIERALDLALQFERGVQSTPATVEQAQRAATAAEGWQLRLSDGRQLRAALLVGADGRHSRVREWAGIEVRRKPYGQSGVVCNFACAAPHAGSAFQAFTADGVLALLPLPARDGADQVSLVWSAPDALAAELLAGGAQALAARLRPHLPALGAQQLGPLEAAGEPGSWPLILQRADSVCAPGLALIGDAAHVVHPLAGHGLNLGLQDVQALAAALGARGTASCGDARLLRRYARARAEQVQALEWVTDGLHRLYDPALSWLAPLRALGLKLTDGLPPLKSGLAAYASGLSVLA